MLQLGSWLSLYSTRDIKILVHEVKPETRKLGDQWDQEKF
jgi:hypothetical protein